MENNFIKLNSINVQEKVEKKGNLSYLSWAWAWCEVKKLFPNANYKIYEREDGCIYWTDGKTCWVKTGVIIDELEHIEYLPVMDFKNKSILVDDITSVDVNKSIQRSLTKALARHGLGLYIYAGEDLPEQSKPEPVELDAKLLEKASQLGITPDKAAIVLKIKEDELTNESLNYLITKTEEKHKRLEEKESK